MDGGKGQVNIALEVLKELEINIPVCGMVKDDNHRTRGLLSSFSPILLLRIPYPYGKNHISPAQYAPGFPAPAPVVPPLESGFHLIHIQIVQRVPQILKKSFQGFGFSGNFILIMAVFLREVGS